MLAGDLRKKILQQAAATFWESAQPALRAYPGVVETLRHLSRDGVEVVAFTDAPIHEAVRRLRAIGVDRYLSGVVATQWFGRRPRLSIALTVKEVPGFVQLPRRLSVIGRLSDDERKPNPDTYARIMDMFELAPQHVTVIGDSPTRDLQPAAALGMRAVWARYGRRHPAREVMLQQVVPFRLPEITSRQDAAAAPFLAIDRFDQLLGLLPTQQFLPLPL
jgi:phosphoglycolate phosphatase